MAQSPQFKVYRGKEYVAAFKYAEDAAAFVAVLGEGAMIRHGHRLVLWHEGHEEFSAWESYDRAAEIMFGRIRAENIAGLRRLGWTDEAINAALERHDAA
jgi:hypothetical protein